MARLLIYDAYENKVYTYAHIAPRAGAAGAAMSWFCRTHFPPLATRPAAVLTASLVPAQSRHCAATRNAPACGWTACAAATAGKRSPPPSLASDAPRPPLTSVCPIQSIQKKRPHKTMCGRSFSLILQPVSAARDLRHPGGRAPYRSFRSGCPDWGCAKALPSWPRTAAGRTPAFCPDT